MQSECLAVMPQFLNSYAWKVPPLDSAPHRGRALQAASEKISLEGEPRTSGWKAYLTSREFQHLASDLTEAIFVDRVPEPAGAILRPACFKDPQASADSKHSILAAILPADTGPEPLGRHEQADCLALAA
jgi:hypothetical protein